MIINDAINDYIAVVVIQEVIIIQEDPNYAHTCSTDWRVLSDIEIDGSDR